MNEKLPFTAEVLLDPTFRKAVRQNARQALEDYGWQSLPNQEIKIVTSTKHCFYIVMPANALNLDDEIVSQIQAAGQSASTAGTVGTGGTLSSLSSVASVFTALCVSSAGTLGSAGTAGPN